MAHYTVKFACGHTAEIQLFGKESERQRKIKYLEESGMCPSCYKKQQEEAKKAAEAQAAAEASEMGLPELAGSEKQVVWATKIRNGLMESISKMQDAAFKIVENAKETGKHQDDLPRVEKAIEFLNACEKVAGTETSAAAFIDWRFDLDVRRLLAVREVEDEAIKSGKDMQQYGGFFVAVLKILYPATGETEQSVEAGRTVEIAKEVTLAPEKKTTDALAEVTYTDDRVDVSSPKDYTVMQVVKDSGFRWTGSDWEMQITVTTGSAVDRAAEIANKLLAAGAQVRVPVEIQKVAVEGNYTPRCTRWVIRITNDAEHVYVLWGRNENWYEKVKCISGAKWMHDLHYMCIPTSSADEVEEFAKLNGFQISAGAKLLINNYREKVKIVIPATAPIEETQSEANGLKDILNSSRDVIEDLKDD